MCAVTPSPIPRRAADWVGLAARLILGGVLLVAGGLKLGNLASSVEAVRAYRMLPYELTSLVGNALPIVEVAVGLMLILGLFTRAAAAVGTLLMLAFVIAIGSVWARGISIDCGCFGGGGVVDTAAALAAYPWEMARDLALMVAGVWLSVRPRTPWALDDRLFAPLPSGTDSDSADSDLGDER